jgi:hypothetical protein
MPEPVHKELLSQLIQRLESDELPWYECEASVNTAWWRAFGIASLILAALTTGFAALMKTDAFGEMRWILVVLPILSALVGGLTQIFRFRETEALREAGRIELADAILCAKSLHAESVTEDDFKRNFNAVRKRFVALEHAQHSGHVTLFADDQRAAKAAEGTG